MFSYNGGVMCSGFAGRESPEGFRKHQHEQRDLQYWENAKNGHYYSMLGYIGIMENKLETTGIIYYRILNILVQMEDITSGKSGICSQGRSWRTLECSKE